MKMLSVNNMLNYKKPSVLNINNLLNNEEEEQQQQKSPSLSPSLTSSPASVSSFTSYPFPEQQENDKKDYLKFYHRQYQHRHSTSSSISDDVELNTTTKNIKDQVHELIHQVNQENNEDSSDEDDDNPIKAKRRRANAKQLEVLNRVFDRTFFPSTQMRAELGRQLGMSPRTVQIWFQNRRQAMRTRERQRLIKLKSTK
jgi:hypothetical protein